MFQVSTPAFSQFLLSAFCFLLSAFCFLLSAFNFQLFPSTPTSGGNFHLPSANNTQ